MKVRFFKFTLVLVIMSFFLGCAKEEIRFESRHFGKIEVKVEVVKQGGKIVYPPLDALDRIFERGLRIGGKVQPYFPNLSIRIKPNDTTWPIYHFEPDTVLTNISVRFDSVRSLLLNEYPSGIFITGYNWTGNVDKDDYPFPDSLALGRKL